MRKTCIKILLLLLPACSLAQQSENDSLKKALKTAVTDSARWKILLNLAGFNEEINRDTALYYYDELFKVAKKNNQQMGEAIGLRGKGYMFNVLGKFPESLACLQQALTLAEDPAAENHIWDFFQDHNPHKIRLGVLALIHLNLGNLMADAGDLRQALFEHKLGKQLSEHSGEQWVLGLAYMNLGYNYLQLNQLDSALIMNQNAVRIFENVSFKTYLGYNYDNIAKIYLKKGNAAGALQNFHKAVVTNLEQKNLSGVAFCYGDLTGYFLSIKQKDSSLYYAKKTLDVLHLMASAQNLDQAYDFLYQSYKLNGKTDSAYKYQGLALSAKDSVFKATTKSLTDFQKLSFKAQIQVQEVEKEKAAIQTKIRTYILLAAIGVLMLLAGIFYLNNRQKQKVNNVLSQQKEEIALQRDNLANTISELKATQSLLIQSEKMASLGELTAGIAHEIQNPLNFVNNFSDVNKELLEELKEEAEKGNIDEVKAIANDVIANEEKINHHGKRADAIVKGMLQHSRSSTGQKESTDIHALADEYLRLSYQGLRAKDKSFNATIKTDFDKSIGNILIIPQDIGRVLLNLYSNAFYAVAEKKKSGIENYEPAVSVSTKKINDEVEIKVADNGNGIPQKIFEKIFQPFFTTKPTGQGTGLGLSLSYDIIKAHGGEIRLESKEGEGSVFLIVLPD